MSLKRPSGLTHSLTNLCTRRLLHRLNAPAPRFPPPTPFVPDASTFLTLIGRKMSAHAAKIPSWEALFTLSSQQLREAGVEPARARRYLLWWRERYRHGIQGIGGGLTQVRDGVAELRIAEVPSASARHAEATVSRAAGMQKVIVNTAPASEEEAAREVEALMAAPLRLKSAEEAPRIPGMRIVDGERISGTGVELVKGRPGVARLKVAEGLWEQRRGHKVDGGERRKAEVRAKRRAKERKDAR